MSNQSPDFWITRAPNLNYAYSVHENDHYITWASGVILSQSENGITTDPLKIGQGLYEKRIAYRQISGWFKMVVYAMDTQEWLFFGDHSGSQFFFMDWDNGLFSDSLLLLRSKRGGTARPDMCATIQLLNMGRIFGERTLVSGIKKTDPGCFYTYRNHQFERHSKELSSLSVMETATSLHDVIEPIIAAIGNQKICAVCTGGTDSRSVLACLSYLGARPDLVITGHTDNPDIQVARKVADKLNLSLTVIDPESKESNWLEKAFLTFDGSYDVVLCYRHFQKQVWVKEHGYTFEFGGVAGEFYKNAFCHPFRWGIFSKADSQYFHKNLCRATEKTAPWFGDALKTANGENVAQMDVLVEDALKERKLLQKCNKLGFNQLACGSGAITNGYGAVCCKIDPLMDRRLVATVSRRNPVSLSMHMLV